jgi:hypothetical protein
MKKLKKIIGMTSIFIFLLFLIFSVFLFVHLENGGTTTRFPTGYTILSLFITVGLTKFITSKIWKKEE